MSLLPSKSLFSDECEEDVHRYSPSAEINLLSTVDILPEPAPAGLSENFNIINNEFLINFNDETNQSNNELSYEDFELFCQDDLEIINNNIQENPSNTTIPADNHEHCDESSSKSTNKSKIDKAYRLPKVPKNDIRRFFANMFMNTINSGEFHHAQSFFHTFFKPKCHFMTTQLLPTELLVPSQVIGSGPLLFAHYFLGLHIMYPDIVLTMHRSRVVTFGMSKMTKVVIDMESQSTKTVHIPFEMWVPPEHLLLDLYCAASVGHVGNRLHQTAIADASPATSTTNMSTAASSSLELPPPSTPVTTSSGIPATTAAAIHHNNRATKRRRKNNSPKHSHTPAPALPRFVPDQYIARLAEIAQPLPEPLPLHTLGQLEFYLDENNHVVSIELRSKLA